MATEDIYEIISKKFPGVELESPVQGWVYLEEYEKGVEVYQTMIPMHTTAQDDRWLGVCYFQLFDDLKAIELFYRAIARKEEAARINLAHAFIFVERSNEVIPELEKLNINELSTYNRILYHRVKSYYRENAGQLQEALEDAETAWRLLHGIPEFSILAPPILTQLGVIYGRLGRATRALYFVEKGFDLLPDGSEKYKLALRKAQLLNILGQYDDALYQLNSLSPKSLPKALNSARLVSIGDATWGKGDISSAENFYEEAIAQALDCTTIYEEFLARFSLAAICGSQGLIATASEHLARAKVLITDKPDALVHQLRDVLVSYWAKEFSAEQTRGALASLAKAFDEIGLLQEQGWVKLHIAEMHRQLGDEKSMLRELEALQRLAVTLQNNNFLAREWTLVPELHKLAVKTHPKIAGKPPDVLELYTMGEEKLVLNGKVVTIRMKKAVEIIAYFLERGKVSLKKMLLDIFPDEDPKKARNYFHQFKHELRERLPGLSLEYSSEERLYTLVTDFDIMWDVAELREGRKMGALGIFLLGSGNEWAELLEHDLTALKETNEVLPVAEVSAA